MEELLTVEQLSERMKISERTINSLGIPRIEISERIIRYNWTDVVAWARERTVERTPEIQEGNEN